MKKVRPKGSGAVATLPEFFLFPIDTKPLERYRFSIRSPRGRVGDGGLGDESGNYGNGSSVTEISVWTFRPVVMGMIAISWWFCDKVRM